MHISNTSHRNSIYFDDIQIKMPKYYHRDQKLNDITKLPFWGSTTKAHRYKQAKEVLDENPQVTNLVAHSLSSSVSAELQKQYQREQKRIEELRQ